MKQHSSVILLECNSHSNSQTVPPIYIKLGTHVYYIQHIHDNCLFVNNNKQPQALILKITSSLLNLLNMHVDMLENAHSKHPQRLRINSQNTCVRECFTFSKMSLHKQLSTKIVQNMPIQHYKHRSKSLLCKPAWACKALICFPATSFCAHA